MPRAPGADLPEVTLVVVVRKEPLERLGGVLRLLGLPAPKGGVPVHQVDPDAFPMRRRPVPGAGLLGFGERFLAQTADSRAER